MTRRTEHDQSQGGQATASDNGPTNSPRRSGGRWVVTGQSKRSPKPIEHRSSSPPHRGSIMAVATPQRPRLARTAHLQTPPTLRSTLRPPTGRIKGDARHCVMASGHP
jgi:hypothetical protein